MSETHDFRWIRVRLMVLAVALAGAATAVVVKAFSLQMLESERYVELARDQYLRQFELPAPRGTIYDRHGHELAISHEVDSVWADPRLVQDADGAARRLARVLGVSRTALRKKLASDRAFVWIERRVSAAEARAVRALELEGVGLTEEPKRFYPNGDLAAHLLGFAGIDSVGLEGLEKRFDSVLKGGAQVLTGLRDAHGNNAYREVPRPIEELRGKGLVLTIDSVLQHTLQRELALAVEKAQARAGTGVMLDPRTGDILAMATVPTFDPNRFGRFKSFRRRNRAVTDLFEPGSIFKILTYAAALDTGKIKLDERIDCENSNYRIGKHVIHDAHAHKLLTVREAFKYSSNIAAAKIGERLGPELLHRYLVRFGIGRRTGVRLPGEVSGLLPSPRRWRRINTATISFGQGVSTSALQMAAAVGAVANSGKLMRPRLVSKLLEPDGSAAESFPVVELGQVIHARTARSLSKIMETVTEPGGTGRRAAITGHRVAGKTGTAQKVDPVAGGYSPDKRVGSFVGFVPAEDPRLVLLISIDEPQGVKYGGAVAGPTFARVAATALTRFGVRQSETAAGARLAARPAAPAAPAEALADGEIDQELERQETEHGRFPDFSGLSVRQVLRVARRHGVTLEIEGSGLAISQRPEAGRPLGDQPLCRVRFRPTG